MKFYDQTKIPLAILRSGEMAGKIFRRFSLGNGSLRPESPIDCLEGKNWTWIIVSYLWLIDRSSEKWGNSKKLNFQKKTRNFQIFILEFRDPLSQPGIHDARRNSTPCPRPALNSKKKIFFFWKKSRSGKKIVERDGATSDRRSGSARLDAFATGVLYNFGVRPPPRPLL